jgi:hypothetical protein
VYDHAWAITCSSGIAIPTISKFENGHTQATHATLFVLRKIFEDAGIEFLDGDGVRFKRQT